MTAATVYIAGPITGYPNHNRHSFEYAAERLGLLGYNVWDPTEKTPVQDDWTWADYVRAGLQGVLAADVLCLLPGWEASRGARLEVDVAHTLGVTTIPAQVLYLGPIIQADRAATLGDTPARPACIGCTFTSGSPEWPTIADKTCPTHGEHVTVCSICGEPRSAHDDPVISGTVVRRHAAAGLDTFERVPMPEDQNPGRTVPGSPRFAP